MASIRFPPPWYVEETGACFVVRDSNGQALAYCQAPGAGARAISGEDRVVRP